MRVRLTTPAQTELAAALAWYARIDPALAVRFLDEYEVLIERLRENPWQFQAVRQSVRRAGFRRFPYGLFYRLAPDAIEIIACFHSVRNPRRWQDRA